MPHNRHIKFLDSVGVASDDHDIVARKLDFFEFFSVKIHQFNFIFLRDRIQIKLFAPDFMVVHSALFHFRDLIWTALTVFLFFNLVLCWHEKPVHGLAQLGTRLIRVFALLNSIVHFIESYQLGISLRSLLLVCKVSHTLDAYYLLLHFLIIIRYFFKL